MILTWSCRDRVANTHFEVLGGIIDGVELTQEGFRGIKLVTFSDDGGYRYESATDHETLLSLFRRQMTYDEWVIGAAAGFTAEPEFGC